MSAKARTEVRVAIVGAGFSGIGMAVELRRRGYTAVTIYERAEDLGGVWHHNTYPGAACDVPSYVYSFSYAQRGDWSRPCSPQSEIKEYLRDIAREHAILDQLVTNTEISEAAFGDGGWVMQTTDGRELSCDVLLLACGQLTRPALPRIPGIERFGGHSFHSAEWDHEYDLHGKRVAVIGTGASAIQFVPPVAEAAVHTTVFQRSAPYLLPRTNTPYPKAARVVFEHVPGVQAARRAGLLAASEAVIAGLTVIPAGRQVLGGATVAFRHLQVRDGDLRAKLTPTDPLGCKRILFSSGYMPALGRPDVTVDTQVIERITRNGVKTEDGIETKVDCIIWGTGFRANEFLVPMTVRGREGIDLQDEWTGGARAHHGVSVPGFPNMFLLYGPNTNLAFGSVIEMLEAQHEHIASAIDHLVSQGQGTIEVRPEVAEASDRALQDRLADSIWAQCDSWYRATSGRVTSVWPGFMAEYRRRVRALDPSDFVLGSRVELDATEPAARAAG